MLDGEETVIGFSSEMSAALLESIERQPENKNGSPRLSLARANSAQSNVSAQSTSSQVCACSFLCHSFLLIHLSLFVTVFYCTLYKSFTFYNCFITLYKCYNIVYTCTSGKQTANGI